MHANRTTNQRRARPTRHSTKLGPRDSATAIARRLERNGDRTDDTWPPPTGAEVGHVEVSLYGRCVRVSLRQVRELVKQQRAWIGDERLELVGLAKACRLATARMGRVQRPE